MFALGTTPAFTGVVTHEGPFLPDYAMLTARGCAQAAWLEKARETAIHRFGREVFVRAVVEVSNFCRENCEYCGMRRDNRQLNRYRARHEELAELLVNHTPASVTDINIQAGEDPVAVREVVIPLIKTLRAETDYGISVCLGTLSTDLYAAMREAGASIYIIKFEIASPDQYARRHAPGLFVERISAIRHLAETGWNVSSGFIAGLPEQGPDELLANFDLASRLPLAGCSVSPFIPGDETPLVNATMADIDTVLNCMAALRLMRPDWVIPAVSALNLAKPDDGYRRGLRTGANLVTINMTPSELRGEYVLYKRDRFIMTEERILKAIAAEGLTPSKLGLAEHYRGIRYEPVNGKTVPLVQSARK